MTNEYYTYIVECKDGSYYTGYTNNIERRMKEHRTGKGAKYIKAKGFKTLRYYWIFDTSSEARRWEIKIKKLKKEKKMQLVSLLTRYENIN